jgi:hypothetical protein
MLQSSRCSTAPPPCFSLDLLAGVCRYVAQTGDVIVGRVNEVAAKRWKIDINGSQDGQCLRPLARTPHALLQYSDNVSAVGVLMLSSVNLPGGQQRRRNAEDQLQMRSFFGENDLVHGIGLLLVIVMTRDCVVVFRGECRGTGGKTRWTSHAPHSQQQVSLLGPCRTSRAR